MLIYNALTLSSYHYVASSSCLAFLVSITRVYCFADRTAQWRRLMDLVRGGAGNYEKII